MLIASGLAKAVNPGPAAEAVAVAVGPRAANRVAGTGVAVRVLAIVEVVLGAVGLLRPGVAVLLVAAVLFVGFNAFLARLRSRDASTDCGCFGSVGNSRLAAVSGGGPIHRTTNTMLAIGLAAAALAAGTGSPVASLPATVNGAGPLVAVAYVVALVTAAWLLATGPALFDAVVFDRTASGDNPDPDPQSGVNTFAIVGVPSEAGRR